MDTKLILDKLASHKALFDNIPEVKMPLICGLESEYGAINFGHITPRFLANGGLLYTDCGHPEYATPEVSNPLDAVRYYEAGKIIAQNSQIASKLYCHNNSWKDQDDPKKGTTFGAHESYATRVPMSEWHKLVPFLIARTVMCGAGWISGKGHFEISQRASFISCGLAIYTTDNRPIVNLRDEPLMDLYGYKRLHIICGDATMNPMTTFLRVGIMSLILEMLEMNALPEVSYDLRMASTDIKGISSKTSGWYLKGIYPRSMEVVSLINMYWERANSLFAKRDVITDILLIIWKDTLEKLARDPMELGCRIDWVTKLIALESFFDSEKDCSWDWLRSQDMEYHNLNPNEGLFYLLQRDSQLEQLLTPELIIHATHEPPSDTRASIRGKLVQYLAKSGAKYLLAPRVWDELNIVDYNKPESALMHYPISNPFHTYHDMLMELQSKLIVFK